MHCMTTPCRQAAAGSPRVAGLTAPVCQRKTGGLGRIFLAATLRLEPQSRPTDLVPRNTHSSHRYLHPVPTLIPKPLRPNLSFFTPRETGSLAVPQARPTRPHSPPPQPTQAQSNLPTHCVSALSHHEHDVAYRCDPHCMDQLLYDLPTSEVTLEAHSA